MPFTMCLRCKDSFKALLEDMAASSQDYISNNRGRLTTNTVEGFHGLAHSVEDKPELKKAHGEGMNSAGKDNLQHMAKKLKKNEQDI